MKSDMLAAEIVKMEQKEAAAIAQLDALTDRGRPELVSLAQQWIDDEVKRQINARPSHVQQIGTDRLREFKAKVVSLKERLPGIAEKITADPKKRPHYEPEKVGSDGWPLTGTDDSYPVAIFRDLISPLGAILQEFGFLQRDPKDPYLVWQPSRSGGFRYPINPGFEQRDSTTWMKYGERLGKMRAVKRNLAKTRAELEKVKAQELFDAA